MDEEPTYEDGNEDDEVEEMKRRVQEMEASWVFFSFLTLTLSSEKLYVQPRNPFGPFSGV